MAETVRFTAKPREGTGKRAAKRLRNEGLLPAVVYGHGEATLSITLPRADVEKAVRHGARVVDLEADGKEGKALIREVQYDHLGKDMLHVDFARVAADERIVLSVPFELKGIAPGVSAGGALDQPIHSISVECLAISVPDSIRVNIQMLQVGDVIHVRELVLPPELKALADPDAVVVQVIAPVVAPEAPVAPAEAAEQAEPEVIGRQKTEAEEESE
jgi:large subunit ribosomal protein L25